MLGVAGTIPDPAVGLVEGPASMQDGEVRVGPWSGPAVRGTPALLAAACAACSRLGLDPPHAFLVGDEGLGEGSRKLYAFLERELPCRDFSTLAFHYLQPDADWMLRVEFAVDAMAKRPRLVADAGFMYAAKMSGRARAFDLFTPDVGELAYLADETAPHPFYARGFLLHEGADVSELIRRAYEHDNAAACLLVKGAVDHVADEKGVLMTVDAPCEEAMEAMGGTGDTVTGIACALVESGLSVPGAAATAALANRLAGSLAKPTPATQVAAIVARIPEALDMALAAAEARA
ncbi:NAD(P)H-hydrate dehydratase [Desulfocurvus sp. DL9XJH121]